jgi:hypothetical protein
MIQVDKAITYCCENIEKMLSRSTTKLIAPIITYGLVKEYTESRKEHYTDVDVKQCYVRAVEFFKGYLGHSLHIGGKYWDAYASRTLPKYGVLRTLDNKQYILTDSYKIASFRLLEFLPDKIRVFIEAKIGLIPNLETIEERLNLAKDTENFLELIRQQIGINPSNFEVFSFAVLKTHLEKFACKLYRDTRTSAHDKGVDLSTNFGVVYQIKKLQLLTNNSADVVFREIKTNFSEDRIKDGNVVLVIDDITQDVKSYLINMKIQSLSTDDIINLLSLFDIEERQKVLRIVFEEFSREYQSDI